MSCTAGKGARAACKPGSPTTAQLPLPVTTVEVAGLAGHVAAGTASLTAAALTNGDADVWLELWCLRLPLAQAQPPVSSRRQLHAATRLEPLWSAV